MYGCRIRGEAISPRAHVRRERLSGGGELSDVADPHHTGAPDRRVEHVVGADDRAGVRHRGARARGMPAYFRTEWFITVPCVCQPVFASYSHNTPKRIKKQT